MRFGVMAKLYRRRRSHDAKVAAERLLEIEAELAAILVAFPDLAVQRRRPLEILRSHSRAQAIRTVGIGGLTPSNRPGPPVIGWKKTH